MKKSNVAGLALAIGAATVFAFAPAAAVAKHCNGKTVHCAGVNSCKGHSSCKTANNQCKGENACKGQGVVKMSKSACDQVGGKVE
jgi:hypothetical protein